MTVWRFLGYDPITYPDYVYPGPDGEPTVLVGRPGLVIRLPDNPPGDGRWAPWPPTAPITR